MIDPKVSDIGRAVVYRNRAHPSEPDQGVLVSFNAAYVFVRYGTDIGAKATRREDCEWAMAGPDDAVPDFTVRDGLWDAETKIADVQRKRHTLIFPDSDDEPTEVTFCNNCGGTFVSGGACGHCGAPQ